MKNRPKFTLITPARNEQDTIELVLQAVVHQSLRPVRWILVSDYSTDNTDMIMQKYAAEYDFITFLRREANSSIGFGSKAGAFMFGYSHLEGEEYSFIGNMDADITIDEDYYLNLLSFFETNSALGVGGGEIMERKGSRFKSRIHNRNSVAGAVQMFRKECFEQIGGYMPTKYGGIDTIAETLARMGGWEVRTFEELKAFHHRRVGMTSTNIIRSRFRYGIRDNHLGVHPLFMLAKCLSRTREKPVLIGSLAWCAGFFYSLLRRDKRPVENDFVKFTRLQQMKRMTGTLKLKRVLLP